MWNESNLFAEPEFCEIIFIHIAPFCKVIDYQCSLQGSHGNSVIKVLHNLQFAQFVFFFCLIRRSVSWKGWWGEDSQDLD